MVGKPDSKSAIAVCHEEKPKALGRPGFEGVREGRQHHTICSLDDEWELEKGWRGRKEVNQTSVLSMYLKIQHILDFLMHTVLS